MSEEIRVRIAPSPTGKLHIGNARTGLFNYLFARSNNGKFILRVDDTDRQRSTKEAEHAIYDGFNWLGIQWDEGPDKGGDYGPYRQSERIDLYRSVINALLESGNAYYCFCSKDEIAEKRTKGEKAHEIYRYDNKCRDITLDQARKRIANGETPVIRLRIPEGLVITFNDLVRDEVVVKSEAFDDFVIVKPNGDPLYNLATVIDDHEMKISHVLRGQDHLTNTSKQILIYNALGYDLPMFGHFSLIMDKNRKKLSKRTGSVNVDEFKNQGFLPQAMTNFIALLGWSPGDNREKMTMNEMIETFSMQRVQKSDAIFDTEKLLWLNGMYLRDMSLEQLTEDLIPFLREARLPVDDVSKDWLLKIVALEQERIKVFSEAPDVFEFFFKDLPYDKTLLTKKTKKTDGEVAEALKLVKKRLSSLSKWSESELESACRQMVEELGWKTGQLFMPIRVAVTGRKATPPLFDTMEVLGRDLSLNRIDKAVELLTV
jgi:nondiscriminating glutamyl-tRNA synthetase